MICKKCGAENGDDNQFCQKCGTSLLPPKRRRVGWIVGSIAAGVLLIAAVLFLIFLPRESEVIGAWHNEELNQLLRFHDDGTVIIRTTSGDYEATFLLDRDGQHGVISLNGAAIAFAVNGDSLCLTSSNSEAYFTRGDMAVIATVNASVEASPTVTATAAPTAISQSTPEPVDEPDPDEEPDPEDTPEPTDTPVPEITLPGPFVDSFDSVLDHITPVVGDWHNASTIKIKLTFESDGSFTETVLRRQLTGTYTYNSMTGVGEMNNSDGTVTPFTVSDDTLTKEDGTTYTRG